MHGTIVKKITSKGVTADDSYGQTMDQLIEPCLLPKSSQLLPSFPVKEWSDAFSQYLEKRVRRNPRDLHAHVQRTLLYLSKYESEAMYAALVDLFLILGKRGSHIRKNLVGQAKPFLLKEQHQFLIKHMESGLDSNQPLPSNTFSSLSRGHSGTMYIVSRKSTGSSQSFDSPVEQAKERCCQNDWLTAMVILEDAIRHDPGDTVVCRELLSLYIQQHAREAFFATYAGLLGRSIALPELWRDTENYFYDSTQMIN
ncbi:MAG: hypothetical protein ABW158_03295 [Candidatus Thiodiazotropha sp. 6PDIVS]